MILVVGLGNIGVQYENTRHNVGFMLVDLFLKEQTNEKISNAKFKGELYKVGSSLLLLKPHTFMNNSGLSVKAVKDFYKCERLIVIHDDIDLNFGTLKFKKGGGSGGHNGLRSIDNICGSDYERIRVGVGKSADVISHVLGRFSENELDTLEFVLDKAKQALVTLVNNSIDFVASNFTMKN